MAQSAHGAALTVTHQRAQTMREFITGNQAIVRAAVKAGCNFMAGYPITPASSILTESVKAFAGTGKAVIQTEDEIAAIGQCIGAAMAGAKVMTASSGPGLSLYSENIGLAQMGEVPMVIVDCQRMGPATGGATATGDGDVVFARHVTAGSYPLPVLAATNAETAYRITFEAFNFAERLRTPVIVLASKDISLTRQTVDLERIELPPIESRALAIDDGKAFLPYAVDVPSAVPGFAPVGGPRRVRFTGSIHDERGLLTIDRAKINEKLTHLREKIEAHAESLGRFELDAPPGADVLVISYGLADGAARDGVQEARRRGAKVAHLTLYTLWPMQRQAISLALGAGIRRVIVPELNIGLYAEELRRIITPCPIESLLRFDGGLIQPSEISDCILGRWVAAAPAKGVRP